MIILICIFIIFITISVSLISIFWPKYEERFFGFGLLGKDKRAETYYPNKDSAVKVGSQINWYVYLHNHMGSNQGVIVRIKLLNSTLEMPNNQEHQPSPLEPFAEFPLSLSVNDTKFVPFSWSISEAVVVKNDLTLLKTLIVNNQKVEVNIITSSDSYLYMIFELWVYDNSSQKYIFGWGHGKDFSSASLQMTFSVNMSAH